MSIASIVLHSEHRNHNTLNQGFRLWCSDLFDVFAERKKRPSRPIFDRGLEWVGYCFQKPIRFLRIFPYFYYKYLLLFYRLFVRNKGATVAGSPNAPL